MVLTWKMEEGLEEAGCIRAFFLIEDEIEDRTREFLSEFGTVPEFEAAVHAGDVIAAQIGELKSEVVYNGDVLNTTARLEALCNPLGHRLLVTEQLVLQMNLDPDLELLDLGPVELRGKGGATAVCAIQRTAASAPRQH